jgi:outer membrane protein
LIIAENAPIRTKGGFILMNQKFLHIIFGCSILLITSLLPAVRAEDAPGISAQPEVLTLEDCLEILTVHSPDLKAESKKVQIANEMVNQAKGNFLPKLDYAIFASKAEDPIYPDSAMILINPAYASTDFSGAGISVTQPLFQGGKLTANLKLALAQLNMALENQKKVQQQLTFRTKQAFYQVWLAEQMLRVAESAYENLQQHVDTINNYYKAGTVSKFEVLRAKVQRDSLKPPVIAAENNLKLAKLNLATLIGFPRNRQYGVSYDLEKLKIPETIPIQPDQALSAAYRNRPEMHQIKQTEDMSRLQLSLAEAEFKPSVVLVGQYQGASMDYSPSNWLNNKYWSCTINVTGNFFNGYSSTARVKGSKENIELMDISETKLRDTIRLEVEQSLQNIAESLECICANQSNIDLAKETMKLTQVRLKEGMATTMDIMDSQLAMDQALNGYYQGITMYLTASANLDLAMGNN